MSKIKKNNDYIVIKSANEHNLKDISIKIPKNKLVIFTGVSGSGKSSLAMDTIYAEGQRRYVESLSSYARQFLGIMKKPDVEYIEGLSPAIAIDQKTVSQNPRSTVGTITEIYDYLRLLYARIGQPFNPHNGKKLIKLDAEKITNIVLDKIKDNPTKVKRYMILSPIVKDRKGEYNSLFKQLKKQGYARARIDKQVMELKDNLSLIKTNKHTIEVIVDRLTFSTKDINKDKISRLNQAIETALKLADGFVIISEIKDASLEFPEFPEDMHDHIYSEKLADEDGEIAFPEIEPRLFSFNSPQGACGNCSGLGTVLKVNKSNVLAREISVLEGAIIPWASLVEKESWSRSQLEALASEHNIDLNTPIKNLSDEELDKILYGTAKKEYKIKHKGNTYNSKFEGVISNLERRYNETSSEYIRSEIEKYMTKEACPVCNGARLNKYALSVKLMDKNINDLTEMAISDLTGWFENFNKDKLSAMEYEVSLPILTEIKARLHFLVNVGLNYLSLGRTANTLAGGEAQRIRLASQIGSGLTGVLYVLDEPSIGLHARDNSRLIQTLLDLRDLGNSILVVEHDEETMLSSDYILDFGPGAGQHGGTVTAEGTPEELIKNENSLTGKYLSGKKVISAKTHLSKKKIEQEKALVNKNNLTNPNSKITLSNATQNNLNSVNLEIPLQKFIAVTGVSGSGKSTLINQTFLAQLREEKGLKNDISPGQNSGLNGAEHIDKIVSINQNPIGRTPRSNPATYTKVFDEIRTLFSNTSESIARGYKPGRFSFNVKGGRCEECNGDGVIKIEMQFMPDVYVECDVCKGKRYNRETLMVDYRNKTIADVLDMTVDEAQDFFKNHPKINDKLETLIDVGLGYIRLGQPATTLSGGEAQRIKLASELAKKATGKTLYILDEPTTGLHFADLERLLAIIKRLIIRGNTVLIIEHNLDMIKNADWIIDLGPEGGDKGGNIIFTGTYEEILKAEGSFTAEALRKEQQNKKSDNR